MNYIIIKSFNQGDWFTKDFCLVELEDHMLVVLKKIELFMDIFQFDLSLFDSAEFKSYSKFSFEFYEHNEEADADSIFDFMQSEDEWRIIHLTQEEVDKLEVGQVEKLDGKHSSVEGNHIKFQGYNKYGDGEEIWSESINIKELLKQINEHK